MHRPGTWWVVSSFSLLALAGCGARTGLSVDALTDGEGGGGGNPLPCELAPIPSLAARIRDQSRNHPDFEGPFIGDDRGIVLAELGDDGAPVYAGAADNPSTHGEEAFFAWFHDVPGVNEGSDFELPLLQQGDGWQSGSDEFFPIDGLLLGNEGFDHNFHFTLELRTTFRYHGGESLDFSGDDDLFVFIDGGLVLDLGGVHSTEEGNVALDDLAAELGIDPGDDAALDLFYAERHTTGSTFHLRLIGFEACER